MAASDGDGTQNQSSVREGYLGQQRTRLTADLDASRALAAEGDAELRRITPQLEHAVDEGAAAMRSQSQAATQRLLKGKRVSSIPEGLVLHGLLGTDKGMAAMWAMALLLVVYASFQISGGRALLTTSGALLVWLPMSILVRGIQAGAPEDRLGSL